MFSGTLCLCGGGPVGRTQVKTERVLPLILLLIFHILLKKNKDLNFLYSLIIEITSNVKWNLQGKPPGSVASLTGNV